MYIYESVLYSYGFSIPIALIEIIYTGEPPLVHEEEDPAIQ